MRSVSKPLSARVSEVRVQLQCEKHNTDVSEALGDPEKVFNPHPNTLRFSKDWAQRHCPNNDFYDY